MLAVVRRVRNVSNRLLPGAVVLCYHRVADLATDPFEVAVPPAEFDRHLQVIRRVGRPSRLAEVVDRTGPDRPPAASLGLRRRVVVTFDDGYADNLTDALPLLERHHVPATLFLSTGYLDGRREFWWDELERLTAAGVVAQARFRRLHSALGQVPPPRRREALDRLWSRAGHAAPPPPRPSHRPLSAEEAARLGRSPLMELGGHTVEHSMLPPQPADVRRAEIHDCQQHLTDLLGRPARSFSYPFGWHDDASAADVRDAGFTSASTIIPVAARPRNDRYHIPRLMVGKWTADELERRLRQTFTTGRPGCSA